MLSIAIVEDDNDSAQLLGEYLERYKKENQETFHVSSFTNGLNFLDEYNAEYDIIFMDIEMPYLSGMDTARKLRELDESVCIIFVTNMAQYAVSGYEVSAMDFIVKPVGYFNFSIKLQRAIQYRVKMQKSEILIKTETGFKRIPPTDIYFIEVSDHILTYHTVKGKIYERGTIKKREDQLKIYNFIRCNNSYLVNFIYITEFGAQHIKVGETELIISRSKKKEFMNTLTKLMGDYIK